MSKVLFILGHDADLNLNAEREVVAGAMGADNMLILDGCTRTALVDRLPAMQALYRIVHYSGHGSLDMLLKKHVTQLLEQHPEQQPVPLSQAAIGFACVDAVRQLLRDDAPLSVQMPFVTSQTLTREMLEAFEAGVTLCREAGSGGEAYEIVKPDGFAQILAAGGDNIQCVLLNCCVGRLQAEAFLATGHIQHVICVRGRIRDDAALEYARAFYQCIAQDWTIERAHAYACAALQLRFSKSERTLAVEDDGGMPQLSSRPTTQPPPPDEELYEFEIDITMPVDDIKTKDRLENYLHRSLKSAGLPIRKEDLEVTELGTEWQIILLQRPDFVISWSQGKRLEAELRRKYEANGMEVDFQLMSIKAGSVVLTFTSSFATLSLVKDTPLPSLDGMQVVTVAQRRLHASLRGSASVFSRLAASASKLDLVIALPKRTGNAMPENSLAEVGEEDGIMVTPKTMDPAATAQPSSSVSGTVPDSASVLADALEKIRRGDTAVELRGACSDILPPRGTRCAYYTAFAVHTCTRPTDYACLANANRNTHCAVLRTDGGEHTSRAPTTRAPRVPQGFGIRSATRGPRSWPPRSRPTRPSPRWTSAVRAAAPSLSPCTLGGACGAPPERAPHAPSPRPRPVRPACRRQ